jgi:phage terminase large subunit-like protein
VIDYVDELCNFPNAKHDDQVDATSQALRRISDFGIHQILSRPLF